MCRSTLLPTVPGPRKCAVLEQGRGCSHWSTWMRSESISNGGCLTKKIGRPKWQKWHIVSLIPETLLRVLPYDLITFCIAIKLKILTSQSVVALLSWESSTHVRMTIAGGRRNSSSQTTSAFLYRSTHHFLIQILWLQPFIYLCMKPFDLLILLTCSLHPGEAARLLLLWRRSSAVDVLPDAAWRHAAHPRETSRVYGEEIWQWEGKEGPAYNFYRVKHGMLNLTFNVPSEYIRHVSAVNMCRILNCSCCSADYNNSHSAPPWRQFEEQGQKCMYIFLFMSCSFLSPFYYLCLILHAMHIIYSFSGTEN